MGKKNGTTKANIVMRFSEFEMPPMQGFLLVGKKSHYRTRCSAQNGRCLISAYELLN
jgi:hypothetical protein